MARIYPFSNSTATFLATPPEPGQTHNWLFNAAIRLRDTLDRQSMFAFLRQEIDRLVTHRAIKDLELWEAINKVFDTPADAPREEKIPWPAKNPALINQITSEYSPLFGMTPKATAEEVIPQLYDEGELVCYGPDQKHAHVWTADKLAPIASAMQFVVPNPMRAKKAVNKSGWQSARCQNNVKKRKYIVAEFDDPTLGKERQASLIHVLTYFAPLVMAVDSGGKSLHAWFHVEDMTEGEAMKFFGVATQLGADRSRWDIGGWLRMPGGTRQTDRGPVPQNIVCWYGRP